MSTSEAGKKGGETVAEERGREFYSEIGKKGGEKYLRTEDVTKEVLDRFK